MDTTFQWLLLIVTAGLLLGGAAIAWRVWNQTIEEVAPHDDERDDAMASLNDRQANRLSDEQLTRPPGQEDAWAVMVRRGQRQRRQQRAGRTGRNTRRPK
jgi:hypothetical protein